MNLVNELTAVIENRFREENKDRVFSVYDARAAKITEASKQLDLNLRRLARMQAGCHARDSVPVRVAWMDEPSPKRPEVRGKHYHKYSWKHPAGFRMTEYEPSTRYVCVSIAWVNAHCLL